MKHTENFKNFRNTILKFLGLLIAPFAFCAVICGILLLIINTTVGDVVGYASVLLMDTTNQNSAAQQDTVELVSNSVLDKTIPISEIEFPGYEQVYGEINIPEADISCPLVYGDTEAAMRKGAGQYIGSTLIGYPGTTMICAHVNRQFANLHNVEPGDMIEIRTTYGVYTYEVKYVGVHSASDDSIYDLAREDENVVMYTCYYQRTALGSVKMRFFVCADYVSGPIIVN